MAKPRNRECDNTRRPEIGRAVHLASQLLPDRGRERTICTTTQTAKRKMRAALRFHSTSQIVAGLWLSVLLCLPGFAADSRDQDLIFHITDFGINQPWNRRWKIGDSFSDQHNRVFPELNSWPGAQILIQMPEDIELDRMDEKHWADLIASTLIDKVRTARANGTTEFEIQIVENMRGGAYALASQQERVARFANSAYSAIGSLIAQEKATTHGIKVDVTAGSNGTQSFTQSTESWKPYRNHIQSVTLVDGRAFYEPTRQAILALGAEKVRISNTYGDMPAHDFSIAKLETTQRLKHEFPALTALLLEPLDLSKRVFGRATDPVVPLSSHVLVMTTSEAQFRVRAVYSDRTEPVGSPVSRYTAREILHSHPSSGGIKSDQAMPPSSFQSTLNSDLYWQNRRLVADGIADNLDLLHGRAEGIGQTAKLGYQGLSFLYDTHESLDYIQQHPGDPASDWERASIGFNLYPLFGPGELLPSVAGGVATLGSLTKTLGEATRSRVLENRAERLVDFGGAVPHGPANIWEERENHYGYFSLIGDRYSAQGGWDLRDSNERLFERDSRSTVWANTQVRGLRTANGSEISGIFRRSGLREERGGSIFNLYEPTSTTITRRSYDSYRVTFDGAHWNERVESGTPTLPIVPPPNLPPPKDLLPPNHDDSQKYPPPRTQTFNDPRQQPPPPPAAIAQPNNPGGISLRPRSVRIIRDDTNSPLAFPRDKQKE